MRRLNAIGSGQLESPGKSLAIPVDQLGIWTSTLCVIHCLVTPIVLSISAVSAHFLPSEARTHRTLAVVIAALGALAPVRGYRSHRSLRVLLIMIAGLSCIFVEIDDLHRVRLQETPQPGHRFKAVPVALETRCG